MPADTTPASTQTASPTAPRQVKNQAEDLLKSAGQPAARPPRYFRYCADGGGAAVTFDHGGHAELIASTAPGRRLSGVPPGSAMGAPNGSGVREVAPGVFVRALSSRAVAVYVADRERITAVAIAAAELARTPAALRHSLHLAGV